ncbi:MAG: FAD-linked oxidase, partial [Aestuariibacter sp.]|nr:FAD-linked oxidase [Aestuariibacter sp.]
HTNPFTINEDVVIPLAQLSSYSRGNELINIRQSIDNKISIAEAFQKYLQAEVLGNEDSILCAKVDFSLGLIKQRIETWRLWLHNFETEALALNGDTEAGITIIDCLLQNRLKVSFRNEIRRPIDEIFVGLEFETLRAKLDNIHQNMRNSRLFVALHMHAGDGNVHTNIPVHSDNYAMLQSAEGIVDEIMQLATSLGGVVSGEHGIGLTKIQYLDENQLTAFRDYKQRVDPEQVFNRGKLLAGSGL